MWHIWNYNICLIINLCLTIYWYFKKIIDISSIKILYFDIDIFINVIYYDYLIIIHKIKNLLVKLQHIIIIIK